MAKKRKQIPKRTEVEILFLNDRTCCICCDRSKGVQIHHIDNNPANNDLSNLAVVCMEHHDAIQKSGGLTKKYSPDLIKKYKQYWEGHVRASRTRNYKALKSKTGIEKTLFEFEIRKTCYEILSLLDNEVEEIKKRLEFLHSIYLLEGYDDKIIGDIKHIILLVAFGDKNKLKIIAKKIPDFFYHLYSGPEAVPMKQKYIHNLKLALGILETIGSVSGEFHRDIKIIESVCEAYSYFWNISIMYSSKGLSRIILNDLYKIIKDCGITPEYKNPLTSGIRKIKNLLRSFKSITKKEQPRWKDVIKKIDKIIGNTTT